MYIIQNYKNYHERNIEEEAQDQSTFSFTKLNLTNDSFNDFQIELSNLMEKYYHLEESEEAKDRTISLVIIP